MTNEYEIRGDITAIFLKSPKYGKMESLISTNKLQSANEFTGTWNASYSKNIKSFYVYGNLPTVNGYRKTVLLHRWITNAPSNLVCDHINHNTLDNTDENLRVITHAENQQNRKGAIRNNSSGIRGVTWHTWSKKWRVRVKNKHIGCFYNLEDAKIAAESAIKEMMPISKEAYQNTN